MGVLVRSGWSVKVAGRAWPLVSRGVDGFRALVRLLWFVGVDALSSGILTVPSPVMLKPAIAAAAALQDSGFASVRCLGSGSSGCAVVCCAPWVVGWWRVIGGVVAWVVVVASPSLSVVRVGLWAGPVGTWVVL